LCAHSVDGRFHPTPFDFDELRAPSREIPLASVKVANRAIEKQRPENEPFGKSGTRCGLFDPQIEEPFGVTYSGRLDHNIYPVTQFKCQVNGPREAGRYNLSVALLGTAMMPDRCERGRAYAWACVCVGVGILKCVLRHNLNACNCVQQHEHGRSGGRAKNLRDGPPWRGLYAAGTRWPAPSTADTGSDRVI
jgi:hypothetical protein